MHSKTKNVARHSLQTKDEARPTSTEADVITVIQGTAGATQRQLCQYLTTPLSLPSLRIARADSQQLDCPGWTEGGVGR